VLSSPKMDKYYEALAFSIHFEGLNNPSFIYMLHKLLQITLLRFVLILIIKFCKVLCYILETELIFFFLKEETEFMLNVSFFFFLLMLSGSCIFIFSFSYPLYIQMRMVKMNNPHGNPKSSNNSQCHVSYF
jgi:hypothetical protein